MQFNNRKILFIDAWPPVTFTPNSIYLFKNIFDRNNKIINCYDYLKKYLKACKKQKNKNSFLESSKIYRKFVDAKKYKIDYVNKDQIFKSLKEFMLLISDNQKFNVKNNIYRKIPKIIQEILVENKCLLSSGNIKKKLIK